MDKLKLYSLSDQIRTILKDGKVISFDLLIKLLDDPSISVERVLQTLPSVGMLVQGNWTVLSEILYPSGTLSGTNGVPADLMCRARDYVVSVMAQFSADIDGSRFKNHPHEQLYKLSRNEPLDRPRIATITHIPPDEVKEIMLTVAAHDKRTGWRLLLPADPQFEQKYSRHKERQDLYWRAKEPKFSEMEADQSSATSSGGGAVAAMAPPKRKRTKSTRSDGGGGGNSSSRSIVDIKQEK